ncbi:Ubiquitin-protein ligase protein [Thalictrum thalictroides]|uniref:Ubiquitin-protein ligase protein n=1 Tax=Thalictrum thalictroides TaxID=46969 RepID=A0A7J6UW97_THATH|nr:Ubiquitin-protein ligase protein [Thalictrum thalictroides]
MDETTPVDWLDLPIEVMEIVSDKLMIHISDFIRFGSVCRLWHSIYIQNRYRSPRQHPGLLVYFTQPISHQDQQLRRSHGFYDFIEKRVFKFPLQLPCYKDFRGSNQGWLIYEKDAQLILLNPFLSANNEIYLPPITRFILEQYEKLDYYILGSGGFFIDKAVLVGNPASTSSYVVVANDTTYRLLAFYKSGNKGWTILIIDEFEYIEDFIYYKDQVYVLDSYRGLFACDVSSHPKVSKVAPSTVGVYTYSLVESNGELLAFNTSNDRFEGYKLDQNLFDWVEINSLSGWSLFMGEKSDLSRLCSNYPEWKPNSVYNIIPRPNIVRNRLEVAHVFKLEGGVIELLYLKESESNPIVYSTCIWIEPTLTGFPN